MMRWATMIKILLIAVLLSLLVASCKQQPSTTLPSLDVSAPQVLSVEMQGLIDGGNAYVGAKVQNSTPHPVLIAAATAAAEDQARRCLQGHHDWDRRFRKLQVELPGMTPAEICAESWYDQRNDSPAELGYEMFKCWHWSPGHWNVAKRQHTYWGGSMAKGQNGIWYSCIIVAD